MFTLHTLYIALLWAYGVGGGLCVAAMNDVMIEERIKLPRWARLSLTVVMLALWPFIMFTAFLVDATGTLRRGK